MKKHPVDELFKNKLDGIQKQPSESAWARLEASGAVEKKRPVVWYALAAAVVLLLLSGGIIWNAMQQSGGKHEQTVANVITSTPHQQSAAILSEPETLQVDPVAEPKVAALKSKRQRVKTDVLQVEKNTKQPAQLAEVAALEKLAPRTPATIVPEIALEGKPVEVIAEPATVLPAKDRVVLVSVETADEGIEPKSKSGKFAKVFRQLKNVRAGEKVDWEEVGFNPKTVIARFDNKLKLGEQEFSNRYQDIKEKTKL